MRDALAGSEVRGGGKSSPSSKPPRGAVLTVFAVLFVVLAISNFSKPFHLDPRAGFVFFGVKTSGIANDILGPAFGVWLLVYAIGIWRMRPWALPLGYAYAAYVITNLVLFTIRTGVVPGGPSTCVWRCSEASFRSNR